MKTTSCGNTSDTSEWSGWSRLEFGNLSGNSTLSSSYAILSRSRVSISSRTSSTMTLSRGSELRTFCIVPQRRLISAFAASVSPAVFSSKPLVDLLRRGDVLVDVPRLIA